jgi:hypothetical protein
MEETIIQQMAQLGAAGLMGILWILERRHSSNRERELTESHVRLMEQHIELNEIIKVVNDNTIACTAMKESQKRLSDVCEQVATELRRMGSNMAGSRPLSEAG